MNKLTRYNQEKLRFWFLIMVMLDVLFYSIFREAINSFIGRVYTYIFAQYQQSNDKLQLIIQFFILVATFLGIVAAYLALRRKK